jgi:lambda family phage portal protein
MITGNPIRVKADRVIFDADLIRPTQINPVSGLATAMGRIAQLESYVDAEIMKAKINACFSMFITRSMPTGGMGRGAAGSTQDPVSGYYGQTITPGMIYEGQPGDDAKGIMSGQASGQTEQFLQLMQGLTGAGLGLSYSAVSRDTSKGNFSSQRQSRLDDEQFFKVLIDDNINSSLNKIIYWFMESEILSGRLPISRNDFLNDTPKYTACDWIPNGMPWVNPLQESKANQVGLDPLNPQITIASVARSQGTDENTLIAQRARETAMIYNELQKQLTPEQYNHYLGVTTNANTAN